MKLVDVLSAAVNQYAEFLVRTLLAVILKEKKKKEKKRYTL